MKTTTKTAKQGAKKIRNSGDATHISPEKGGVVRRVEQAQRFHQLKLIRVDALRFIHPTATVFASPEFMTKTLPMAAPKR